MAILLYFAVALFGVIVPSILLLLGSGRLDGATSLALCAGVSAYSLMAINLFLATRPRVIERGFGGLDRLYVAHKWVGISVLVLAFTHQWVGIRVDGTKVTTGLASLAFQVGQVAFYVLVALILMSWIKRLPARLVKGTPLAMRDLAPYHWWRWTHRVIGLVFVALTFHQFFVEIPFNANATVSGYLTIMALVGIASFLFTQFGWLLRRRRYTVTSVDRHPLATVIDAAPKGRPIRARAGGFAFLSAAKPGLREPHPFTLSAVRPDGSIQFSVRGLGDYTKRLGQNIAEGDTLRIEGGYGRFDRRRGGPRQVWLAGGIGITPFLAFADSLSDEESGEFVLVHAVSTADQAIGQDRLKAATERCSGFTSITHVSADDGRLTAEKLSAAVGFDLREASLFFCGPKPLRHSILKGLGAQNARPRRVFFEEFEFR